MAAFDSPSGLPNSAEATFHPVRNERRETHSAPRVFTNV